MNSKIICSFWIKLNQMMKSFAILGFSFLILLFSLFQVALFVWDSVILLSYTECLNCINPIYTWLSCVTALQILTICINAGNLIIFFRIICTIVAYCYGVEYYGNRDFCNSDGANAIYTLVIVHLTVYTIEYIIIFLGIILCAAMICGFGMETADMNEIISRLQPLNSINSIIGKGKKEYETV